LTSLLSFALWVGDITYVPTLASFLHLSMMLGASGRRATGPSNRTERVVAALDMTRAERRPTDAILHSDQGEQ
jgi:putative transposase